MSTQIQTDSAPKALGPYSQAVKAGNLVFCSGQLGINPADDNLAQGIKAQTEQVLKNLQVVLKAANCGLEQVVRCDIFLTDLNDFVQVNEVYAKYFSFKVKPARQTAQVSALPKNALVEISCVALTKNADEK